MKRVLDALWSLIRSLTRLSEVLEGFAADIKCLESKIDSLEREVSRLSGKLEVLEKLFDGR